MIDLGLQNLGHLIVATGLNYRVCLYRYNITVLHLFHTVSGLAILGAMRHTKTDLWVLECILALKREHVFDMVLVPFCFDLWIEGIVLSCATGMSGYFTCGVFAV